MGSGLGYPDVCEVFLSALDSRGQEKLHSAAGETKVQGGVSPAQSQEEVP